MKTGKFLRGPLGLGLIALFTYGVEVRPSRADDQRFPASSAVGAPVQATTPAPDAGTAPAAPRSGCSGNYERTGNGLTDSPTKY